MRYPVSRIALVVTLFFAACTGASARDSGQANASKTGPAGDYPMVLGAPFVVDGVTYTPADTLNYDSVGYAQAGGGDGVSGAHRCPGAISSHCRPEHGRSLARRPARACPCVSGG